MSKKAIQGSKNKRTTGANVRVKKGSEVLGTVQEFIARNVHGRYNLNLSNQTQKQLVAYGPWLAALLIFIILPQLIALAKTSSLMSLSGFFEVILFNQSSWVILLMLLANTMLFVDGVGYIFTKAKRGWDRIYLATLLSSGYIVWQLFANLAQPSAPMLSLIGTLCVLFILFDIRKYYT